MRGVPQNIRRLRPQAIGVIKHQRPFFIVCHLHNGIVIDPIGRIVGNHAVLPFNGILREIRVIVSGVSIAENRAFSVSSEPAPTLISIDRTVTTPSSGRLSFRCKSAAGHDLKNLRGT